MTMKKYFSIGMTIISIILVAESALADDMWSETPGLNNLTNPSAAVEPNTLSNKKSTVDMWAETPDLNNTNEEFEFESEETVVKAGIAHSELYAETPDLNRAVLFKKGGPPANDIMISRKDNITEF